MSVARASGEVTVAAPACMRGALGFDIAAAQTRALAYVRALRSRDASEAAALMTPYRRPETRAPGWTAEIGWWKDVRVRAVMHPGRYLRDERAFAQLYAEKLGHPPNRLVVVNVSYGAGPGVPAGDTDFVLTQDSASAPWLVHDFGGALQPAPASTAASAAASAPASSSAR